MQPSWIFAMQPSWIFKFPPKVTQGHKMYSASGSKLLENPRKKSLYSDAKFSAVRLKPMAVQTAENISEQGSRPVRIINNNKKIQLAFAEK